MSNETNKIDMDEIRRKLAEKNASRAKSLQDAKFRRRERPAPGASVPVKKYVKPQQDAPPTIIKKVKPKEVVEEKKPTEDELSKPLISKELYINPVKTSRKPTKILNFDVEVKDGGYVLKEQDEILTETFKKINEELKEQYPHLRWKWKTSTSKNGVQYIYYSLVLQHKNEKGSWKRVYEIPEEIPEPEFLLLGHKFHKLSRTNLIYMTKETLHDLSKLFRGCEIYELRKYVV